MEIVIYLFFSLFSTGKIESVRSEAEKNKTNILENSDLILERREKIRANASLIAANQSVVAKFISESL